MSGDLNFHMRELRADLSTARDALVRVRVATPFAREHVRAWLEVESLIEHDLEVHVPALNFLLGHAPSEQPDLADRNEADDKKDDLSAQDQVANLLAAAWEEMDVDSPCLERIARARALLVRALRMAAWARAQSVNRANLD